MLNKLIVLLIVANVSLANDHVQDMSVIEYESYIQNQLDVQHIPAMSILIFKEDQVLYENYLGKSQLQENIPLADDHLFLLASISKVITATALLQLYDEGKFLLDDRINDYLPFNVSIPNYSTDITFRMLLTHTSAIADGSALDDQYYSGMDSPVELKDFLEQYLVPGGNYYDAIDNFDDFNPGSEHNYSNTGNTLIGLLVEQISGVNFNTYCKDHIFTPLGMENTFWHLSEITQTIVQPYKYINNQFEPINHYTFTDYPNGGLRSTSKDLHKFLSAIMRSETANNFQLLNPDTVISMHTPQIPLLDETVGLHLFLFDQLNGLWGHDGGEDGVATIMAFNPDTKVGAIILSNQAEVELEEVLSKSYMLGLELSAFKVNSGLNGGWYNPETSGQGFMLEILPETNRAVFAWFTYDAQVPVEGLPNTIGATDHRWLTGLGEIDMQNKSITFDVKVTSNGLFDNPQEVTSSFPNSVGSLTITFDDCKTATVSYDMLNHTQLNSFPISRISSESDFICEAMSTGVSLQELNLVENPSAGFTVNNGLAGGWYNEDTSGQGILLDILPQTNRVFLTWFTYDTQEPPENATAIIGDPSHRWLTGLGEINTENNTVTIDLKLTTGGKFDDPTPVQRSESNSYGRATISFDDCSSLQMQYDIFAPLLTGNIVYSRISNENVALCEYLSDQ